MRPLALFVLLALAVAARAQPAVDWLTRADGLPSDYVLAVHVDRWGFVWFGTDAGAVRWDGRRARTFTVDDGLPHTYVTGFAETADGTLWAATNGGLARQVGARWEPVDSPLGPVPVGRIQTDGEGRLVASAGVVARLEGEGWRVARSPAGLGRKTAPLLELGGGRLLVSGFREPMALVLTPSGPGRFRTERWPIEGLAAVPPGSTASIHRIEGRLVLLLTDGGGRSVRPLVVDEAARRFRAGAPVPTPGLQGVAEVGETVGFGPWGLRPVDLATGRPGPMWLEGEILDVAVDREGGLWAGTFGTGVARVWKTGLTAVGDLPARRIALRGDVAWAVGSDGFTRVDLAREAPSGRPIPTGGRPRAIGPMPDGRYRVTTGPSLWPGLPARDLERFEDLLALPITAVAQDPGWMSSTVETADTLWMGTYGAGVRRFRIAGETLVEVDPVGVGAGLPSEAVEDVVRTSAGTWALSRRGLARLRGDRARTVGLSEGLPSSAVHSLFEASDGTHWAGTDRGVARLDLGAWRAEAVGAEAMAGRPVVAMFERPGAPGVVWAVTTRALWRVEGDEARRADGVPVVRDADETVEHAAYHAPSDRLVLATSAGVAVASPGGRWAAASAAPPVAVVSAAVGDAPVALAGTPRDVRLAALPPGPHRVEIQAAALRYGGPSAVEWRGRDGVWRDATDGRVVLPEVGPGAHVVEVRAVAPGGAVSAETARLAFRVAPHWWERRPVQAALALLALAGLIGGIRYLSQRPLRARVRELEVAERLRAERARIGRDLHDHVGAEVAALLAEAEVGRLEAAASGRPAEALRVVEDRARQTMGSLREAVWALSPGTLTVAALTARLEAFARGQARPSGIAVEAESRGDADRPLPPTRALALYRIGQEAIRNAVCHGGGTRLRLTVEAAGARVVVEVWDDGQLADPVGTSDGGYGLGNMRARAEALGGTFALTNGQGTTARASIPLGPDPREA